MKIIQNYIMILGTILVLFSSCEDDTPLTIFSPDAATGVANFSANNLVLDRNNAEADALTISFNKPDFGYDAGATYQVLFDLAGGDFSAPEIQSAGTAQSVNFTTKDLNAILISLGATPDNTTELLVKVETVLSPDTSKFSETSTVMVTPYADVLDLSSRWGLVGSATVNAWDGPDMPFYKTTDKSLPEGSFVAYVTLTDGEIKIRADNAWDTNYGDNEPDDTLEQNGGNIVVAAGTYKISFNENTLTYAITECSWGLVGDATANGWDGPDMPFTYDSLFDNWKAAVSLTDGAIKIRKNNDWSIGYGDVEPDGILDTANDNNIAISAGDYLITFNPTTLEYSIK